MIPAEELERLKKVSERPVTENSLEINAEDYDGWISDVTRRIYEMEEVHAHEAAAALRAWLEDAKLARMMGKPLVEPPIDDFPF